MSDVAIRIPYLQRRVEELALDEVRRSSEEESDKHAAGTGNNIEPHVVDDVSSMVQQNEYEGSSDEGYSDGEESYDAPDEIDRDLIIKRLLKDYTSSHTGPTCGYCSACVENEVRKICRRKNGYPTDYNPAVCATTEKNGCCTNWNIFEQLEERDYL